MGGSAGTWNMVICGGIGISGMECDARLEAIVISGYEYVLHSQYLFILQLYDTL